MIDYYEEHLRVGVTPANFERCYYWRARRAGDKVYYWCELSGHPCMMEYGDSECEEYNDFLKEVQDG